MELVRRVISYRAFAKTRECVTMAGYWFREHTDVNFTFGRANGRRRVAKQVYRESSPHRKQSNHQTLCG